MSPAREIGTLADELDPFPSRGREPKKPTNTVVNREKYLYGRYDVGDAGYYPGNAGPKPETPRDAIYEVGPGTGRSAGRNEGITLRNRFIHDFI